MILCYSKCICYSRTLHLHTCWTCIHMQLYLPGLDSKKADLQLQAGAIIRNELSQRRCRSLLPSQKKKKIKTGKKIKTESSGSRTESPHIVRTIKCSKVLFSRGSEKRERQRRDKGWRKTLRPIVATRQTWRHEGIISRPSFIKSVYCYDTSPFVVISRTIVVALFIMAFRHSSGAEVETSRSPSLESSNW